MLTLRLKWERIKTLFYMMRLIYVAWSNRVDIVVEVRIK